MSFLPCGVGLVFNLPNLLCRGESKVELEEDSSEVEAATIPDDGKQAKSTW